MNLKIFNFLSRYFVTHYRKILLSIIYVSFFLFVLSVFQVAIGNIGEFQPVEFGFGLLLYGAFVWADVMVFSLLWIIISIVLLRIKQKEFFWIAYFSYWFIRSSGEVVYSFLQQFHPETKPWLIYVPREVMQNNFLGHFILKEFWIVYQIFFQSIAVLSLFGLIFTIFKLFRYAEK